MFIWSCVLLFGDLKKTVQPIWGVLWFYVINLHTHKNIIQHLCQYRFLLVQTSCWTMSLTFTQVLRDRWIGCMVPALSWHTPKWQLVHLLHSLSCSALTMTNNNKSSTGFSRSVPAETMMLCSQRINIIIGTDISSLSQVF